MGNLSSKCVYSNSGAKYQCLPVHVYRSLVKPDMVEHCMTCEKKNKLKIALNILFLESFFTTFFDRVL